TRHPGLPLGPCRLDRLISCRTLFAAERLSPSARERIQDQKGTLPAGTWPAGFGGGGGGGGGGAGGAGGAGGGGAGPRGGRRRGGGGGGGRGGGGLGRRRLRLALGGLHLRQGVVVGLERLVVDVAVEQGLGVGELGLGGLGQDPGPLLLGLLTGRVVAELGEP